MLYTMQKQSFAENIELQTILKVAIFSDIVQIGLEPYPPYANSDILQKWQGGFLYTPTLPSRINDISGPIGGILKGFEIKTSSPDLSH